MEGQPQDPLPTPLGAIEARLRALEKIQSDQTAVMEGHEKRVTDLEGFVKMATETATRIQKKTGGLLGGMFA